MKYAALLAIVALVCISAGAQGKLLTKMFLAALNGLDWFSRAIRPSEWFNLVENECIFEARKAKRLIRRIKIRL